MPEGWAHTCGAIVSTKMSISPANREHGGFNSDFGILNPP
jgi:hypothetical protein